MHHVLADVLTELEKPIKLLIKNVKFFTFFMLPTILFKINTISFAKL